MYLSQISSVNLLVYLLQISSSILLLQLSQISSGNLLSYLLQISLSVSVSILKRRLAQAICSYRHEPWEYQLNPTFVFKQHTLLRSCTTKVLFAAHRNWSTLPIARWEWAMSHEPWEYQLNPTFVVMQHTLLRSCSSKVLFAAHRNWSTLPIARWVLHSYIFDG